MHEFSICRALLQQLETLCRQRGSTTVKRVTLQVGVLSGVEPQLLAAAFRMSCAEGCARKAELRIEMQLLSGDELLLCDADLTDEAATPDAMTATMQ